MNLYFPSGAHEQAGAGAAFGVRARVQPRLESVSAGLEQQRPEEPLWAQGGRLERQ